MPFRRRSRARAADGGRRAADPAGGLARDVADLRVGAGRWSLSERTLMVAGGVLAPVGVAVVVFGWVGAARTSNVYEQIPYLISGGLLGLALVFLGGFLYFAHWMTQSVKEQRAGTAAMVGAVDRLAAAVERQGATLATLAVAVPPAPPGPVTGNGTDLVATETGTMAHRPTCRVVAGRAGLRSVTTGEDLEPCRLCRPYG
ncbi:MAG: hypothetical protein ACRD0N_09785 [Acidimicrobiales bacterium]